jgi:hypothetical protein
MIDTTVVNVVVNLGPLGLGAEKTPNNQMQRTCQKVTHFACAKCAPFWHAADLGVGLTQVTRATRT